MTFEKLEKFEQSMIGFELKRLKSIGYTDEDAEDIVKSSFNSNMIKLLLFLIYAEVKKK